MTVRGLDVIGRLRGRRAGRRHGLAVATSLVLVCLVLAACGSTGGAPGRRPPATGRATTRVATTVPTSTSTSTSSSAPAAAGGTTTSLPQPVLVPGTRPGGSIADLGPVERLAVVPLSPGTTTLPQPTATSSPASTTTAPQLDLPGTVAVAYREFGSGPDLLLVPGQHATMSWWGATLLAALAQQYTVVTFDLPGTGYSGPDPSARTIGQIADVTAGLSASLGLTTPTVLGWGLGGEVALALAERHPGLPGRLVLADTSAGGPTAVRSSSGDAALLASPSATYTELSAALFPPTSLAARAAWTAAVARIPSDVLTASAVSYGATLQASAWADSTLAAGLARLSLPVLAVVGSVDGVFPPADTTEIVAGIRGAKDLVFPGAGYASILEDEPQFVLALEKFTSGQSG